MLKLLRFVTNTCVFDHAALQSVKKAAKAKLIFRGVKEVTKALRKKEKGFVDVYASFLRDVLFFYILLRCLGVIDALCGHYLNFCSWSCANDSTEYAVDLCFCCFDLMNDETMLIITCPR